MGEPAGMRVSAICTVCYDPREGLQLRLDGRAIVHNQNDVAERHWSQHDLAVRYAYGISHRPGERLPDNDPRSRDMRQRIAEGREEEGREYFAVIEVQIEAIDWFQTTAIAQRRAHLHVSRNWQPVPLTP